MVNEVNKLCNKESYALERGIVKSSNNNILPPDPRHQTTLFENKVEDDEYIQLLTAVELLNDRLIKGEIGYVDYYNRLSDVNQQLEATNSEYKVRIITQEDQQQLIYLNASDFIELEEDPDVTSWNASFGINGGPTC